MESRRFSSGWHSYQQPHDQFNPPEACWCKGASNIMEVKGVQDLMVFLEEVKSSIGEVKSLIGEVKSSIPVEIEKALTRILPLLQNSVPPPNSSSLPHHAESSASRSFQLCFKGELPDSLLTMTKIEDECTPLTVELCDESGKRVESEPESCSKVKFVVLDGDFEVEDKDDWTEEEFKKYVAIPRKDKTTSLLKGNCQVLLGGGCASVHGISFTDNSKSMRNGKFRLGAQVIKGISPGAVVRPAVSTAFKVKERRLITDRKHPTPSLTDELWRLVNINKTGQVYGRAKKEKISTVQDFLQLYHTNETRMQNILKVAEKKWQAIVENAEACKLIQGHYEYCDDASGDVLILNCVFKIESVAFKGQNSQIYESLDSSKKEKAGNLREAAYEKRDKLKFFNGPISVPAEFAYPTSAQQLEQEQQPAADVVSFSSDQVCIPPRANMQYPLDTPAATQDCIQQENMTFTASEWFNKSNYYEVADYGPFSKLPLPIETVGTAPHSAPNMQFSDVTEANQGEIGTPQMFNCSSANSFNLDDLDWICMGTEASRRWCRAVNTVIIIRRFVPGYRPQKRQRT